MSFKKVEKIPFFLGFKFITVMCIKKDLECTVAEAQVFFLAAQIFKGIDWQTFGKDVIEAEEDDVRVFQFE